MNKENIIAQMGIKKGMQLKFKFTRGRSGMYPSSGEGYVEDFVRNGILVKTSKGYRVTIHDFDMTCEDVILKVI